MSSRYVVIMAGGSGTRFWPKSRHVHPKQFLSIGGTKSLLRQTADRALGRVPKERVFVVTGAAHADHARSHLPELPAENILVEPTGRNTAPCIGWAAMSIAAKDPAARIAVLPSDHFIGDEPGFYAHLDAAFEAAADRIVTFGIVPSHPETGYGYIRRGAQLAESRGKDVFLVDRFVEKPDRATAMKYLSEGVYLWNSGMFVFPAKLMNAELARLLPELYAGLERLMKDPSTLAEVYPKLPSISIDYGVMEKSDKVAVLPAQFGWSDVGSWDAAMDVQPPGGPGGPGERGNVVLGDAMVLETQRSMVDAQAGRFVALVGVDDLIVVDTADAVLVIKRGESQRVKDVVDALKTQGRKQLL